jgi:hypothetical protein
MCSLLAFALPLPGQDPWHALRDGHDDATEALVDAIRSAKSEDELLLLARQKRSSSPGGERIKLLAAARLADLGTTDSLPLLQEWSSETATYHRLEDGCRDLISIPVYPFPDVARFAQRAVTNRLERDAYLAQATRGDFLWITAGKDATAAEAIAGLGADDTDRVRPLLNDPSRPMASAAAHVRLGIEPSESFLLAIPEQAALALLQAEVFSAERLSLSPHLRSRLAVQEGVRANDGESMLRLARTETASELHRRAVSGEGDLRVLVGALLLQDSDEARERLRSLRDDPRVAERLDAHLTTVLAAAVPE